MALTRTLFRRGSFFAAAPPFLLAAVVCFVPADLEGAQQRAEGPRNQPVPWDTIRTGADVEGQRRDADGARADTTGVGPDAVGGDDASEPPAGPPAPDTTGVIELEELMVDILRSPMSLEAAPFAVSVLGDEIRESGRARASIEEALHGLPGVHVQNRFNAAVGERITIRGFGARSPSGVRGVSMIVDGIPATLPDGQSTLDHLDLGTLGRVEALRGPGSSLYGNAAGGVLIFETRPPSQALVRQEVETVQGDHGLRRLQSTTSGTIGEGDYLLSLSRYEFDGFRPVAQTQGSGRLYGGARRNQLNTRARIPAGPGKLTLTGNLLDLQAEDPGSLDRERMLLGNRQAMPIHVEQHAGHDLTQGQAGVGWVGSIGDLAMEVMTYGVRRNSHNPGPAEIVALKRSVWGGRALVRSEREGTAGRMWWTLGVEVGRQADERQHAGNDGGLTGEALLNQSERVAGNAVFLQAMLPINPILNVLTGLRYDRIRFSARDHLGAALPDRPDGSGGRTLDSASPSFGFHASLDPRLSTYLNLSTAFETPTTTEMATNPDGSGGFNPDIEPQVGFTVEAGIRGLVAPILAYEAVYFHTTLHGELTPFELQEQPGVRYFRNSTRSTRSGLEASLQFAPSRFGSVRLTYATNNARFQEFDVDGENLRGKRVPGLPPRRAEALLRVGPGSWFIEYRAEYTSAIPGNSRNEPEARSPAYRLSDVRLGLNDLNVFGVRLSPFAGVTNLFDEFYNTSVVVNAARSRYFEPGPGRNIYFGGTIAVQRQ